MKTFELGLGELDAHFPELLHAHAVLARDRPADFDAELEDFRAERLRLLGVAGTVRVVEDQRMQVAVACVEHVHARQPELDRQFGDSLQDRRQCPTRNRTVDTVVGRRDAPGGSERRLAPRPEALALFVAGRHVD